MRQEHIEGRPALALPGIKERSCQRIQDPRTAPSNARQRRRRTSRQSAPGDGARAGARAQNPFELLNPPGRRGPPMVQERGWCQEGGEEVDAIGLPLEVGDDLDDRGGVGVVAPGREQDGRQRGGPGVVKHLYRRNPHPGRGVHAMRRADADEQADIIERDARPVAIRHLIHILRQPLGGPHGVHSALFFRQADAVWVRMDPHPGQVRVEFRIERRVGSADDNLVPNAQPG